MFAVACREAPAPSPASARIPETDLDDEHLRAFVPPDWPVGRTWAIEGVVGYDSETALEEQGTFNTWWRGEIELRVVDNDGEKATIEAAVRRDVSNHVPASWRLTYSLEPFFVVAAHTEGITRGVETRDDRSVLGAALLRGTARRTGELAASSATAWYAVPMAPRVLLLLTAALGAAPLAGCGASSELDETSEEELCDGSDGASWSDGDPCGGVSDRCGQSVCETVIGEGCQCPDPGMCWDGSACVEGPSYANSFESSPS